MDNKLMMNVLMAAAIYMATAALFGAGAKMIAQQVPAQRTDPQFATAVCALSVACSQPESPQGELSFDKDNSPYGAATATVGNPPGIDAAWNLVPEQAGR